MSIKIDFIKKNKIFFDEKLSTGEDIIFCRDIRNKKKDIAIIPNSNVYHEDRVGFQNVLNHQAEWGRHQFYTVYKYKIRDVNLFYQFAFSSNKIKFTTMPWTLNGVIFNYSLLQGSPHMFTN